MPVYGLGMQRCKDRIRSQIVLEMLCLANIGLSPDEFGRNFDANTDRVQSCFENLASRGLIRQIQDNTYEVTEVGRKQVIRRGDRILAD